MAPTIPERFDREARRLGALFLAGPRLVVIGSTDFWHRDSERTCTHVGRLLTDIPDLVLITGGVEGIGEATGRSFFQARRESGQEPRVYLAIEGGPGTVHEAEVAAARNATIIPVGRSGGHSAVLYARMQRPAVVDEPTWAILGAEKSTPEETALAALRAVRSSLQA